MHRVALVTEFYYPHLGGVCEHVHHLARELRARGHHADIITARMGSAPARPGVVTLGHSVPIYLNGSHARFTAGLGLGARMRDALDAGGYDVVHVHSPLTPTLPMLAIREARVPVVGTMHTFFRRSVGYRLLRRHFQRAVDRMAAVIAVSPTARTAYERYFDADWRVIPNGVDLAEFRPDVPRPPEFEPGADHVLFLGRLDPRNGLAPLLDAYRLVRARRAPGARPLRLAVVGDGPLLGHYRACARREPDVIFLGARLDGRAAYYAHSDVYACPTDRASFGITLLEAMACGTPIVCSDIDGFRDVVRPGREALMPPVGDVGALAGALQRVLVDRECAHALSENGRVSVRRYGWPRVATEVLSVYDEVTA